MTRPPQSRPLPKDSDWLAPHLPQLGSGGKRLIEIGCGPGLDAATLLGAGFGVTALDRIPLERAREHASGATLVRADLSRGLPFRNGVFHGAIASLSMHYLPWAETRTAFSEVRRVLADGAPFLFRVNATDDFAHGAGQGEELEPNFYRDASHYHAATKRFFDETTVLAAVVGWFKVAHLEHKTIYRYDEPKRVWECLAFADG